MVIEWFLSIFQGVIDWFLGLFGTDGPPSWMAGAAATLIDVIEGASGLGAWFPFVILGTCAAFLLTLWLVLWSIKGIRWVWGLTPFSGGS